MAKAASKKQAPAKGATAAKKGSTPSKQQTPKKGEGQFNDGGATAEEDRKLQDQAQEQKVQEQQKEQKQAAQGNKKGFKPFGKGAKIKHGTPVEFTDSQTLIGVYNEKEGKVYVNGIPYTPAEFREVDASALGEPQKNNLDAELRKEQTFEELGVPQHRRGENLHEHNLELQRSIKQRNEILPVIRANENQEIEDTKTGSEADTSSTES